MIITGAVLIMDGTPDNQGEIVDPDTLAIPSITIPVLDGQHPHGSWVASAELKVVDYQGGGKQVEAKIHIDDQDFERLSMMRPGVVGSVGHRVPLSILSLSGLTQPFMLKNCVINSLELTLHNQDPRIMTLSEMKVGSSGGCLDGQHEPVPLVYSTFCKKCNKTLT